MWIRPFLSDRSVLLQFWQTEDVVRWSLLVSSSEWGGLRRSPSPVCIIATYAAVYPWWWALVFYMGVIEDRILINEQYKCYPLQHYGKKNLVYHTCAYINLRVKIKIVWEGVENYTFVLKNVLGSYIWLRWTNFNVKIDLINDKRHYFWVFEFFWSILLIN